MVAGLIPFFFREVYFPTQFPSPALFYFVFMLLTKIYIFINVTTWYISTHCSFHQLVFHFEKLRKTRRDVAGHIDI